MSRGAPAISGEPLEALVNEYRATVKPLERLSRLYVPDVLWAMLNIFRLGQDELEIEATVEWAKALQTQAHDAVVDGESTCFVRRDSERNIYFPVVKLLHAWSTGATTSSSVRRLSPTA